MHKSLQFAALQRQVAPPAFTDYWAHEHPKYTGSTRVDLVARCNRKEEKSEEHNLTEPGVRGGDTKHNPSELTIALVCRRALSHVRCE